MSELTRLLSDTGERLFTDLCTKEAVDAAEQGAWPDALWRALDENGLLAATVPEDEGGVGLPLREALTLLRPAGRAATPAPLAESLLAGALAGAIMPPSLPIAIAIPAEGEDVVASGEEALELSGEVAAVPFGSVVPHVLAIGRRGSETVAALVEAARIEIAADRSISGDPLADLRFSGVRVPRDKWKVVPGGVDPFALAALGRAVLMTGALEWLLAGTVAYALDRKQFGRPIADFQAIQHQLAQLAGETAAAIRASDGALEALGTPHERVEIAIAKARVGEAAGLASAIAHQVHGAMGFTYEHPLHQRTRRLWSWRDQYGSERYWNAETGRRIAGVGADGIWAFVTRVP
jgi:alkylation response protein AidB-like acyl-CoA dehydrogenase